MAGAAAWRPQPGAALLPACEPEPVVTVTEVATGPEGYFVHRQKRVLRGKVSRTPCTERSERSRCSTNSSGLWSDG